MTFMFIGLFIRWLTLVFTSVTPLKRRLMNINYEIISELVHAKSLGTEDWDIVNFSLISAVQSCFACRDESIVCHNLHISMPEDIITTNLRRSTVTPKRIQMRRPNLISRGCVREAPATEHPKFGKFPPLSQKLPEFLWIKSNIRM